MVLTLKGKCFDICFMSLLWTKPRVQLLLLCCSCINSHFCKGNSFCFCFLLGMQKFSIPSKRFFATWNILARSSLPKKKKKKSKFVNFSKEVIQSFNQEVGEEVLNTDRQASPPAALIPSVCHILRWKYRSHRANISFRSGTKLPTCWASSDAPLQRVGVTDLCNSTPDKSRPAGRGHPTGRLQPHQSPLPAAPPSASHWRLWV